MNGTARISAVVIFAALSLAASANAQWVSTFRTGMDTVAFNQPNIAAVTHRNKVSITQGGNSFRFWFSNEHGIEPLTIGAASAGLTAGKGDGTVSSPIALTFNGQGAVTLAPGTRAVSDPITIHAEDFGTFLVSVYTPAQKVTYWTYHDISRMTNYQAAGNQVLAPKMSGQVTTTAWWTINAIDVVSELPGVVVIGDSITDGFASKFNSNQRWPNYLGYRLHGIATVTNTGISGNAICKSSSGGGPAAPVRQPVDVLASAGVRYYIVADGFNDVHHNNCTAEQMIAIYEGMVASAHANGIKVYIATITPSGGLTGPQNVVRNAVNQWIRTGGGFDGVIDFDLLLADPSNPNILNRSLDSGDHTHPSDYGNLLMAKLIPVWYFEGD